MGTNDNAELYSQVKKMIVKAIKLKSSPESIENNKPLFGSGGVGLDSIDALELVIALEKEFGVRIPDASVGKKVLVSVETIVQFIQDKKSGKSS
ncbi:MAG: phosphopantetheine-binding protein [Candidatus Omnitrophota bacterium]